MAKFQDLQVSKAAKELLAQLEISDIFVKDCREEVERIKAKYCVNENKLKSK